MTTAKQPFWIDYDYDRDRSSNGDSRYTAYVLDRRQRFEDTWYDGDPEYANTNKSGFAATAWSVATSPVMAPGLVRYHPRISGAEVERSQWDSSLIVVADVISELPDSLRKARPAGGGWFSTWHLDAWDQYEGIGDRDLASGKAFLLPSVRIAQRLTGEKADKALLVLPEIPKPVSELNNRELSDLAWQYIEALVPALNQHLEPVINALEGP